MTSLVRAARAGGLLARRHDERAAMAGAHGPLGLGPAALLPGRLPGGDGKTAVREAYRDRARGGVVPRWRVPLLWLWFRAALDSVWNGVGERVRPAIRVAPDGAMGPRQRAGHAPASAGADLRVHGGGTLAVGLGAFAVVFTAVDRVLLAPLPYEDPDDLYFVWRQYGWFDLDRGWLGGPDVAALAEAGGPIQAAVGMQRGLTTLAATPTDEPQEASFIMSSPELFEVLGVQPLLGRGFAPDEVGPGPRAGDGARIRPLADPLRRARGRDRIGGAGRRDVVHGDRGDAARLPLPLPLQPRPPQDAELYITFAVNLAEMNPGGGSYAGLVRARPGSTPEAVQSAVASVGSMLDERDHDGRGLHLYVGGDEGGPGGRRAPGGHRAGPRRRRSWCSS
jgi:hypothetical protein